MNLEDLRQEIDLLNEEIIRLLARRRAVTKQVAMVKKNKNLPVFDGGREEMMYERVRDLAAAHELDPSVVESLFRSYVRYCRQEMAKEMEV